MAYNFDLVQDRRNTGSVKWDVPHGRAAHVPGGHGLSGRAGNS